MRFTFHHSPRVAKKLAELEHLSYQESVIVSMSEPENKRRRIVIDEDEEIDEEVISNPDEFLDDKDDPDEEEGEDLEENWLAYETLFIFI